MPRARRLPCPRGPLWAVLCFFFLPQSASADAPPAASALPPTLIQYRIEVTLDPVTRALHGHERIQWQSPPAPLGSSVNPSLNGSLKSSVTLPPRPIDRIPMHLYLNGFENEATTWMRSGSLRGEQVTGVTRLFSDPWGKVDLVHVRQLVSSPAPAKSVEIEARPIQPDDGNPFDRSLVELVLAEPIGAGATLDVDIEFEARLPIPIARTGGRDDYFFAGQFYPKIGAWGPAGVRAAPASVEPLASAGHFAARQFRGPTEFYADFADYDVSITVPAAFLVGATGVGASETEGVPDGMRRMRFHQRTVHDFAFVAGSHMKEEIIRYTPTRFGRFGGNDGHAGNDGSNERPTPVDIHYIVPAGTEHQIQRWRRAAEATLDVLYRRVGVYPYATLTVVMTPFWAMRTAGMEYPTLVTGGIGDPMLDLPLLSHLRVNESTIAHEIAHNYFYGLLASNEQEEAFLDEGFTQFWEGEITATLEAPGREHGTLFGRNVDLLDELRLSLARHEGDFREPIVKRPAGYFAPHSEGGQVYTRPALCLVTAARLHGQATLDTVFATYFARFRFRHPTFADFTTAARDGGGVPIADFLTECFTRERLPDYAVADLGSARFQPPLGLLPVDAGTLLLTEANRAAHEDAGLDPAARETDGRVFMEITDAGFLRGGESRLGGVERKRVTPALQSASEKAPAPSDRATFLNKNPDKPIVHESHVRLDGPAWDHLPVDIEFRFSDGVTLLDHWDGRSAWRSYRFLRPATLDEVRIDPDDKLAIDVNPANSGARRQPSRRFTADWSVLTGAFASWLTSAVSLWL